MLRCGSGGGGGEKTEEGIHGARSVEQDILSALRCDIMRISLADNGHVNVWKGKTVGAVGTEMLPGS